VTTPLILALDPGTEKTGWCLWGDGIVYLSGVMPNVEVSDLICSTKADVLAVEMVASFGMAVGKEVFRTVWWTGRFSEQWVYKTGNLPMEVFRKDVKIHLCGTTKAKDKNIRVALIDLIGPQGKKASPGPTFGVSSHAWSALAVAITAEAQLMSAEPLV
jgi:hypothetical protein